MQETWQSLITKTHFGIHLKGMMGNENSSGKAVWSQTSMFVFGADALILFALVIHRGIITATILSNLVKTALCFSLSAFKVPCFEQHHWLPWQNPILLNLLGKHWARLFNDVAVVWIKTALQKQNRKHDSEVPFYMHLYVAFSYVFFCFILNINTHCVHTRNKLGKNY